MSEFERARQWREKMGLTRPQLAELTGFSVSSIVQFEQGYSTDAGAGLSTDAFRRYKLCCGFVAAKLIFDWGPVTIRLDF